MASLVFNNDVTANKSNRMNLKLYIGYIICSESVKHLKAHLMVLYSARTSKTYRELQ